MTKKNMTRDSSPHSIAIFHPQTEMRSWLKQMIAKHEKLMLLWQADTTDEMIMKTEQQTVDVLLLDAAQAKINVQSILSLSKDCLILLISNKSNQTGDIFNALGAGAKDVVSLSEEVGDSKNEIIIKDKLQLVLSLLKTSNTRNDTRNYAISGVKSVIKSDASSKSKTLREINLVIIGSSTGGPEALSQLLAPLSKEINAAIIIIQHLDGLFINEFVSWLTQHSDLPVSIAEQGKQAEIGHIYVAHPNAHLIMDTDHQFSYVDKPGKHTYQPSINEFFSSIHKNWTSPGCAVLLTGMGKDGAKGLKKLQESGWITYAQEKKSCAVYGMPKAALEMGAVEKTHSLKKISSAISEFYENN